MADNEAFHPGEGELSVALAIEAGEALKYGATFAGLSCGLDSS